MGMFGPVSQSGSGPKFGMSPPQNANIPPQLLQLMMSQNAQGNGQGAAPDMTYAQPTKGSTDATNAFMKSMMGGSAAPATQDLSVGASPAGSIMGGGIKSSSPGMGDIAKSAIGGDAAATGSKLASAMIGK